MDYKATQEGIKLTGDIIITLCVNKNNEAVILQKKLFEHFNKSMFSFRMIIGLSVGLGLMLIELIGFIGGISMFMPFQSMLCILMKKFVRSMWFVPLRLSFLGIP